MKTRRRWEKEECIFIEDPIIHNALSVLYIHVNTTNTNYYKAEKTIKALINWIINKQ